MAAKRNEEKRKAQEEKERIRLLLEEDKKKRENKSTGENFSASTTNTNTAIRNVTHTTTTAANQMCSLQIRLPEGQPLRRQFPAATLLTEVHTWVSAHLPPSVGTNFTFLIPFPVKQEFGYEDMGKSLSEAGLVPSSVLTVYPTIQRGLVKQSAPTAQTPVDLDNMTYEEVVQLENRIGKHKPESEETIADKIAKIPSFEFTPKEGEEIPKCLICQCDFESGELAKSLPLCSHLYHVICIDPWLRDHDACPMCNQKCY